MPRTRSIKRCAYVLVCLVAAGQLVWILSDRNSRDDIKTKAHGRQNSSRFMKWSKSERESVSHGLPILLWWDSVYTRVHERRTCGDVTCWVSNNRSLQYHPDTKAFIFYGSHFKPFHLPLPRKQDQLWALFHEESPRNAYLLNFPNGISVFNTTATFSRHAHYPLTTQWLQCPNWIHEKKYVLPLVDKNRLRAAGLAPILYLHSDCGVPSDRDSFVTLLQKYIPVDSYGSCVKNKNMPEKLRFRYNMAPLDDAQFFKFAARYKFTLSMENYKCDDYVTEKLWRPLRLGSVPIVFGASNIKNYLPSNRSAILVEDFQDIEDLADYIHLLDTHDKLYLQYLEYKDKPVENNNLANILNSRDWQPNNCNNKRSKQTEMFSVDHKKYDSIFTGYECYLCNIVSKMSDGNNGNKIEYNSNSSHYGCPSPRRFNDDGIYRVHNSAWSAEWSYGKYEALALNLLMKENRVVTQKEFYKIIKKLIKEDQSRN